MTLKIPKIKSTKIKILLLFGQVDQQDVPVTGQPSKRQSKNKKQTKQNKKYIFYRYEMIFNT
jgi:hypothetical protein